MACGIDDNGCVGGGRRKDNVSEGSEIRGRWRRLWRFNDRPEELAKTTEELATTMESLAEEDDTEVLTTTLEASDEES